MTTLIAVSTHEYALIGSDSRVTNSRGNWNDGIGKITSVSDLLVAQTGDVAVTGMMVDIIETFASRIAPSASCTQSRPVAICSPLKGEQYPKACSFSLGAYLSKPSGARQLAAEIRKGVDGLCDSSAVMVAGLEGLILVFWSDGSFYTPLIRHGSAVIGAEGSGGAYALGAMTTLLKLPDVKLDRPATVEKLVRDAIGSAILCDRDSGGDIMVAMITTV